MGAYSTALGDIATKSFQALSKGFEQSDVGESLGKILKEEFIPQLHRVHQALVEQEAVKPINLQRSPGLVQSEAKEVVRKNVLGQNDWVGVAHIKAVENEGRAKGWTPLQINKEQQNLADHVHMFLRDTEERPNVGKRPGTGQVSRFKMNVVKTSELGSDIKVGAHYRPPTKLESDVKNFVSNRMLAGIAIPHIGTLMNYALNTPTQDLAKGFADVIFHNKDIHNFAHDFGIYDGTVTDAWTIRHLGAKGVIAQKTNQQFGQFVAQITHQPGFNVLRDLTISFGAASGKHTLERMSENLISSGGKDTFAIHQLKRFGVNPAEVLINKGLTPDMMRRGIFTYVDSDAILDTSMQRSFYSNANVFTRLGSMYHGYISKQGKLIRNTLLDMYQQTIGPDRSVRGALMTAKTLGMLAIAFPNVGLGLKTLEMYGRGQYQEADPIKDYENLWGANGPSAALVAAIDGYAHMCVWGIASDYYRGAIRHELASSMAGPIGNEIYNILGDATHSVMKFDSDNPNKSMEPLERDVLEDLLPDNLGKIIAHQTLPNQTEQKNRQTKFSKGFKRDKSFSSKNW